jgi:hypothetical protein
MTRLFKENFNKLISSIGSLRFSRKIMFQNKTLNSKESSEAIIRHYRASHKCSELEKEYNRHPRKFPKLPPLDRNLIKEISAKFSRDKAITYDGIEDHLLRIHFKCAYAPRDKECQKK